MSILTRIILTLLLHLQLPPMHLALVHRTCLVEMVCALNTTVTCSVQVTMVTVTAHEVLKYLVYSVVVLGHLVSAMSLMVKVRLSWLVKSSLTKGTTTRMVGCTTTQFGMRHQVQSTTQLTDLASLVSIRSMLSTLAVNTGATGLPRRDLNPSIRVVPSLFWLMVRFSS